MRLPVTEFAEITDNTVHSPVILHAPHGGTWIPEAVRDQFIVSDTELQTELNHMTDHSTDEMARLARDAGGASAVINRLSRLVVDVERFDDESEEKNQVGMGVLYTHGAQRSRIREMPRDMRPLKQFYADYAATMTRLCEQALARHGRAIIFDVHSYNTLPLGHELHTHEPRPELCVGYEEPHCGATLRGQVRDAFAEFQQGDNQTFHGAYVPLKYYQREPRVQSVMLEIRRDQYLDERTFTASSERVGELGAALTRLVESAAEAA